MLYMFGDTDSRGSVGRCGVVNLRGVADRVLEE